MKYAVVHREKLLPFNLSSPAPDPGIQVHRIKLSDH